MDTSFPTRTELYPEIEPFATGRLAVDRLHTLYFEESGNPDGIAVVVLHGGPGAGGSPSHRRFFDPAFYRIVVFDQRGAGRSTPLGELRENTTRHLIGDLEALRGHLCIDRWLLFGGSWGSTLALAYAQAHPQHCLGLVLRGIFLCRRSEIEWFLYGVRNVFPEDWHAFAGHVPEPERHDLLKAYWRRLNGRDPAVRIAAARAWSAYEGACSTLRPSADTVAYFSADRVALGLARIEAHYFRHGGFLSDDQLLANIERVRALPGVIVQGRYDMVCPIVTADALYRAWPQAQYVVVPDAGHSAWEPGIRAALVSATERFKTVLAR
jgi:proline iminopeptidase